MKVVSTRRILPIEVDDNDINYVVDPLGLRISTRSQITTFINKFYDEKPDIFYFWKDEPLTRDILKKLKSFSPKTKFVMAYWDQRGTIPTLIVERRGLLDAILINNEDPQQFKMYHDFGIKKVFTFNHYAYKELFEEFNVPTMYNVCFGGNNFNHRKFPLSKFRYDFIMRTRKVFDKFIVYGTGWPFKTNHRVSGPDFTKVLQTAKINLGMNHYDVLRYYDRRIFECMASGRVHITKYIPGMEKHFENFKHLVWFNSIKEGLNAIQNMLKYPEKRETIAAAGKKLVMEQHSSAVRAIQLKNILLSL